MKMKVISNAVTIDKDDYTPYILASVPGQSIPSSIGQEKQPVTSTHTTILNGVYLSRLSRSICIFTDAITRPLKEYPNGSSTSRLYRNMFHAPSATSNPAAGGTPILFDKPRYDYAQILQPTKEKMSLSLTFKITGKTSSDLATMNELAMSLRTLPHVSKISSGRLYSPRRRLASFVSCAQMFRALVRKSRVLRRRGSIL